MPWQEAIRAWCEDGKSFRIEMGGKVVFEQSSIFRMGLSGSSKIPELGIDKDWFEEGKWYIED